MTNINTTFNTLDSALEGAKAAGNDIFSGYENEIPCLRRVSETLGINKWLLTDNGLLLMVIEYQGERSLSEVTVHTCVSAHDLTLAIIDDNQITPCPALISKSDTKSRKEASRWYYLIDQGLASKLAA
tara:strand:- start:270 stop:653 length:384 start_codon:yes stop_codon:yes gene_type:complete